MFIDSIDTSSLSANPLDAFLEFERQLRKLWLEEKDRENYENTQGDGYYLGNFHCDRLFVSTLIAFIDEYDVDVDVENISNASDNTFQEHFSTFCNEINSVVTRLSLRKGKTGNSSVGTPISYTTDFKEKIGSMLSTIRKIVNQEIDDENKKDAILKKIALLQLEVDRDRTTYDAIFSRAIEFSRSLGEIGENIEPLVDKVERLKKLIWDGSSKENLLPKSKTPKLIEPPTENGFGGSMDEEIPF